MHAIRSIRSKISGDKIEYSILCLEETNGTIMATGNYLVHQILPQTELDNVASVMIRSIISSF